MNLELDHIFIIIESKAKVADLLITLGLKESFSRDHQGQGTSNRRFEFSNGMLELLWVRDSKEAMEGPGQNLLFPERSKNENASPFGVVLTRKDNSNLNIPFTGWSYQPDYFSPPMAFHVGNNSTNINEPLCIYVPFIEPVSRTVEKGTFKSLSSVKIFTKTDKLSNELTEVNRAERLSIESSKQHLMEVTLDENQKGLSKDFRPDIPLIIHW